MTARHRVTDAIVTALVLLVLAGLLLLFAVVLCAPLILAGGTS